MNHLFKALVFSAAMMLVNLGFSNASELAGVVMAATEMNTVCYHSDFTQNQKQCCLRTFDQHQANGPNVSALVSHCSIGSGLLLKEYSQNKVKITEEGIAGCNFNNMDGSCG